MKTIYICAPFRGNIQQNIKNAVRFAQFVYKETSYAPVTPHCLFPFIDDNVVEEREDALRMDMAIMKRCDEVWALADTISVGMQAEIDVAKSKDIPVRLYKTEGASYASLKEGDVLLKPKKRD